MEKIIALSLKAGDQLVEKHFDKIPDKYFRDQVVHPIRYRRMSKAGTVSHSPSEDSSDGLNEPGPKIGRRSSAPPPAAGRYAGRKDFEDQSVYSDDDDDEVGSRRSSGREIKRGPDRTGDRTYASQLRRHHRGPDRDFDPQSANNPRDARAAAFPPRHPRHPSPISTTRHTVKFRSPSPRSPRTHTIAADTYPHDHRGRDHKPYQLYEKRAVAPAPVPTVAAQVPATQTRRRRDSLPDTYVYARSSPSLPPAPAQLSSISHHPAHFHHPLRHRRSADAGPAQSRHWHHSHYRPQPRLEDRERPGNPLKDSFSTTDAGLGAGGLGALAGGLLGAEMAKGRKGWDGGGGDKFLTTFMGSVVGGLSANALEREVEREAERRRLKDRRWRGTW